MIHSLKMTAFESRSAEVIRCTNLAIKTITQQVEGYCEFDSGQTCVAQHVFQADIVNIVGEATYLWTTDKGTVIGNDTDPTFEVWVTDNKTTTITVTLTVTDFVLEASLSAQFESEHIPVQDCIFAETDGSGTWQGYEYLNYGVIEQENTSTGEIVHAIKWLVANDGTFRIQIGETGDVQLVDTDIIDVLYLGLKYEAIWDGTGYQINDVTMTTDLTDKYNAGDRIICFGLSYLPNLVISIDFEDLI